MIFSVVAGSEFTVLDLFEENSDISARNSSECTAIAS